MLKSSEEESSKVAIEDDDDDEDDDFLQFLEDSMEVAAGEKETTIGLANQARPCEAKS